MKAKSIQPKDATQKSKQFKLDGAPLDLALIPPLVRKITSYLDSLPDDELVTTESVAKAVSSTPSTLRLYAQQHSDILAEHFAILRMSVTRRRVWGNKSAIKALRTQVEGGQ